MIFLMFDAHADNILELLKLNKLSSVSFIHYNKFSVYPTFFSIFNAHNNRIYGGALVPHTMEVTV
jgi:hypothetical protein